MRCHMPAVVVLWVYPSVRVTILLLIVMPIIYISELISYIWLLVCIMIDCIQLILAHFIIQRLPTNYHMLIILFPFYFLSICQLDRFIRNPTVNENAMNLIFGSINRSTSFIYLHVETAYVNFPFMFQHTHVHTFVLINCSWNDLPTYSHDTFSFVVLLFPFFSALYFFILLHFRSIVAAIASYRLFFFSQMHSATKMTFQSTSYVVCTFLCPTRWTGGRAAPSPWSSTRASVVSTMLVNLLFYTWHCSTHLYSLLEFYCFCSYLVLLLKLRYWDVVHKHFKSIVIH